MAVIKTRDYSYVPIDKVGKEILERQLERKLTPFKEIYNKNARADLVAYDTNHNPEVIIEIRDIIFYISRCVKQGKKLRIKLPLFGAMINYNRNNHW